MTDTTKTATVGVYVNRYGNEMINRVVKWIEESEDYVRITEPTEVVFKLLDHEEVLESRLACLDREIESVRAKAHQKIENLKDQKQRLLAITHEAKSDD